MDFSSDAAMHLRDPKRTLVIMAKAPQPGMVKTRLSQSLPAPAVAELYRCFLQDTITLSKSLNGVELAIMCPASDSNELERLFGNAVEVVAQKGEGLAAGLISVFSHFAAAAQHHVVAFNSDTPHLPATLLKCAFQALIAHDVIVGPTHDGGYYLVGARGTHATLFENDGLGTTSALERLLGRARALELSTGLTEPFYDIDIVDDLIRLAGELQLEPNRAPRTAAWLDQWRQTVAKLGPRTGAP